ncbi:hypothetical protein DNU06_05375 [Putridiphycobacter roseus]|uniref:DUF306 domain-containing protein n=1 Tax=Putridiphycobacter roseus TaxID=2219161 RepID=A0A2W1N3B2_9FLAO|nr:META domain-containing protein [Putridiphycobacter roseus]PZE18050.1 hypothetical protein DNU06_05375 [Putridiphycobacter roseus]
MTIKQLLGISLFLYLITGCITSHKTTYWINSVKTTCHTATGEKECLMVKKGADLDNTTWQSFMDTIAGFEFEVGYLKKIQVKEKRIQPESPLGSLVKYTLIKEVEKQFDYMHYLDKEWVLTKMNAQVVDLMMALPSLEINTIKMQVNGNGGCNIYGGSLDSLTENIIKFGPLMSTRKACLNDNIESVYLKLMQEVSRYQIKNDCLLFFNEKGDEILSFTPKPIEKVAINNTNKRLHDIWITTSINGGGIKRLSAVPYLEINLTNQQVYGFNGCNEFQGNIKAVDVLNIQFVDFSSTIKACEEPNSVAFMEALSKVNSYRLKGVQLTFFDMNDNVVLSFIKGD